MLPKDSYILLSTVNTLLRDYYKNLDELCDDKQENKEEIMNKLSDIGYSYDTENNRFSCRA